MIRLRAGLAGLLFASVGISGVFADGIKGAPSPFDKGGVKIALVSYLSQGDYFEAYEAGVARQAKALGLDLHIFQGKQDAALQREQIDQAIALGVQGIIVSHGQPEAVKDEIQKALDAGIKVVVKDIDIGNPKVPLISQSDHEIAQQVLAEALKKNGDKFSAGYVFVAVPWNCAAKSGRMSRKPILASTRKPCGARSTPIQRPRSLLRRRPSCVRIPKYRSSLRLTMSSRAA
jgi:simple sugar transport system substrate-binding protein